MSIQDKIKSATPTTWLTDGIPKWQVIFVVCRGRLKVLLGGN